MTQREINRMLKEIILELTHYGKLFRTSSKEVNKRAICLQQDYSELSIWLRSHDMWDEPFMKELYNELDEIDKLYKVTD